MSYLYVIRGGKGLRKIGTTIDPQKRMWALQSWNVLKDPGPMVLEHTAECSADLIVPAERHAHALVWDRRVRSEWFDVDFEAARDAVNDAVRVADTGGPFRTPPPLAVKRTTMFMPTDLFDEVTDYRFDKRHKSFNDAVLELVRTGLEATRGA